MMPLGCVRGRTKQSTIRPYIQPIIGDVYGNSTTNVFGGGVVTGEKEKNDEKQEIPKLDESEYFLTPVSSLL